MEYILQAIFQSGGSIDWEMISETNYEWEEIFDKAMSNIGTDNIRDIDFNCLVYTILEMAQYDFIDGLQNQLEKYRDDEDYKEIIKKIDNIDFEDDENWEIWTNYSDNHISLFVKDDEVADFINTELANFVDKINDDIGFTYINIE